MPNGRYRSPTGYFAVIIVLSLLVTACTLIPGAADEAIPTLITEPPPASAFETRQSLLQASAPERDLVELAQRLRHEANLPRVVPTTAELAVGDVASFWYKNHDSDENEQIPAELVYRSAQLNMWLEEGQDVDEKTLQEAAQILEKQILPRNRAFFGEEWRPGIDGDPRLHILHLEQIGGNVVGYFSAADEFTTPVNPFSNQREMFYISLEHAPLGSAEYYGVIAHEMQHMIHWNTDSNESTWVDEGLSVLAAALNGYGDSGFDAAFAAQPDVQLTSFDYESEESIAHYGASYLFASYFLDRFGEDATRMLVQHPENGVSGFSATLQELGLDLTFDQLFSDWVVATYLDSHQLTSNVYHYEDVDVPAVEPNATYNRYPLSAEAAVNQYGVDYIRLQGNEPVTVIFTGTQQSTLLHTVAHSGDFLWSTLPADDSDMTLTGRFDLSGLEQASMNFWSWYEIEEGWDYAYLSVSSDEGETWQLLATEETTENDPQGNSYGPGLTGNSGGGSQPRWIEQTADLTPFTGGPVLIRFEYVTDDAVHRQGLALDDISIPELGYADDVEAGNGLWQAAGFVRHTNILPQSFLLQVILLGKDGQVRVEHLSLDENQRGRWTVPLDSNSGEAILVVSGNTPVTTLPAAYAYQIAR